MHIKKVIIEGFKSYKEEVSTDPFSPKVNCVVGANGSGKTNFFHAIRFVLSDLFQNLRSEDRHALLHEGAGHQVVSAFVEIVFDNSDNRIPVDRDEVRLRRTISLKKDEYFLDGKHVTKTEVMNLLESAGFSRSNPYYVVQQGKIASLTLMKDSERLDLLKEIGGTRVYEERRRESLKIMQETGNKRKQIDQVVQYLEERLRELDEEKEELRKYQQLDKQRRSLEYTIYDKELNGVRQKLDEEKKLQEEIHQLKDEDRRLDMYIRERKTEYEKQELLIAKGQKDSDHLRRQRDELQDTRKSLWNEEANLSAEIDKLKSELIKAQKSLDHATPGDIRRGLNSVNRIIKDHNIRGVFGPILELIECDPKFFTAVEVTAGNSLFHVVVETDDISTKIIRYLTAEKGGRVTFIPLNRVKVAHITYPQSSDVVPLLKKLKFRSDYAPAFSQVFGRTVICRDLDVATSVARNNSLDCITLEGDQVSKKGGMTGGFYDFRRSKLKFVNMVRQNKMSIHNKTLELDEIGKKLKEIDQEITKLVSEQQKMDAHHGHVKSELEQLKNDIANATKQKQSICKALEKKEKLLTNAHNQIDQIQAGIAMKQAEMGTELIDQLTPEERDLLSRLNPEITELKEKLLACKNNRIEIETRKEELETNLSTNLVRRQQELEGVILSADSETLPMEAELKRQELKSSRGSIDKLKKQLEGVLKNIDGLTQKMQDIKTSKESLKMHEDQYERTLQDEAKELEQLLSRRNILLTKQDDCMKKIRDLGSLPSDAFDTYKRKNIKELQKLLHACNEQLKQFSHVNKKALDQYINFTEQREQLQIRRAELDAGDQKIRELIAVLDQRKDESIERTFKGVARHFREVFSELVQGGHGYLVMMKKKDGDLGDDDHGEDGPREPDPEGRVEKYIGVKVKVSFTGQGETQSMKQLSGGQKTVVALTLIFAIQRCDPAPFYLFDEIDAALDPQYRTAVGNMIRRLADMANTQFITTTFRPELVKVADKIYGVTHKNRVSHVNVVSKEQALDFIEHDQSHNAD
ncbi:structural maintenance of chromosomes protein 3-like isoform X3 [Musa acuminata AAA Group]|uniref:structural maintenance of chromosomes protein 3-like isoform X3 n=1 Tax=Musa acuminata AAA Group TaxID=214697 RepID=UPI0031CF31FB